jgi:hypothetical protein
VSLREGLESCKYVCAHYIDTLSHCARLVHSARALGPRPRTPRRPLENSAANRQTQVKEIEEVNEAGTCAPIPDSKTHARPLSSKQGKQTDLTANAPPTPNTQHHPSSATPTPLAHLAQLPTIYSRLYS